MTTHPHHPHDAGAHGGVPARKTLPGAHDHVFLGADHARNERRTWYVIALTAVMMVIEIAAGYAYGSMALLADGFHMSTHASALAIAALGYLYARRHARDPRFSFGTGKIGDLAAFSSAIVLALIALGIGYESAMRLVSPIEVRFGEAMLVAVLGLGVNLVSALLLRQGGHAHHHDRHQGHEHHGHDDHAHGDRNMRAAYMHVLADALTSVFAIVGLGAGWLYGWTWVDALAGIVGALVIANWSLGLLRDSGAVLLDMVPNPETERAIRGALEKGGDRISDLHLWRVGPGHMAAVIALVSPEPREPLAYKRRLAAIPGLSHVSVEVSPA